MCPSTSLKWLQAWFASAALIDGMHSMLIQECFWYMKNKVTWRMQVASLFIKSMSWPFLPLDLQSIMLYKSNETTNLNNLPDSPFSRTMSQEKSQGMEITAKLILANWDISNISQFRTNVKRNDRFGSVQVGGCNQALVGSLPIRICLFSAVLHSLVGSSTFFSI